MDELEKIIANLGYPVGMGMAPSPADLARMKYAIISNKYREGYDNALAEQSFDRAAISAENGQLRAEIERLRAAINWQELEEYACTGSDKPCGCYNLLEDRRNEVIEECARVAEGENPFLIIRKGIPAAIRALKGGP